jgi:secreted Zn-dependent insulinase-like peptidase
VNSFYAGGSLIFSTMGYNDKLSVLMETTINELKNYKVDPERFALLKDDVRSSCLSFPAKRNHLSICSRSLD